MNWKEYEREIFEQFQSRYPNASIKHNEKVLGRISKIKRQIDVLIEDQSLDASIRTIVDAKRRTSPIDINDIETFISMMIDVGAHRGILVSPVGYTKGAITRAHNEVNQDIDLDIYSLEELQLLQGQEAIPYSGNYGVVLLAPFGWVIDAKKREGFVASLYQRGYDLNDAGNAKEWMYINFWTKETPEQSLEDLLKIQSDGWNDAKLSYLQGVNRTDAKTTLIRLAEVPHYTTPEYTGFVEFDEFIFFAVLFTPIENSKRNLRKLREVMRTVLPIQIKRDKGE
jgi:hypothetical protein